MIKQSSVFKTGILLAVMALVFLLNLSFSKEAAATIINFNNLGNGTILSDQYSADGIYFRGQLSLSPEISPGVIDANRVRLPSGTSLFILLTNPANYVSFWKWEPSWQPSEETPVQDVVETPPTETAPVELPPPDYEETPPGNTVYLNLFKHVGTLYPSIGSISDSTKDAWVQVSLASGEPISAVEIYGLIDNNLPFYLDDLRFETSSSAVPLPATMLLLGSGLAGLAGFAGLRRKFRKN